MAESVVFQIDVQPTIKQIQELNAQLAVYKTQLAETKALTGENSVETIQATAQVKAQQKEINALNTVLVNQQRAVQGLSKSVLENINAGKANLNTTKQNQDAYRALSGEANRNANTTDLQRRKIKELNDVLKQQEAALGNTGRNVGNYRESLEGLVGSFADLVPGGRTVVAGFQAINRITDQATATFTNFKQSQEAARQAQDLYAAATSKATIATEANVVAQAEATTIGFKYTQGKATQAEVEAANTAAVATAAVEQESLAAAQVATTVATTGTTQAMKLLKVAIAATGVGALLLAVAALVEVFTKFQPVVDAVEVATNALGASFSALVNGNDIFEAAEQSIALTKAMQDLEDAQIGASVATAKLDTEIKRLLISSKDRTKSEQERLALLDEASSLELKNLEIKKSIAAEELRIAKEAAKSGTDFGEAEINALIERGRTYGIYTKEVEASILKENNLNKQQLDSLNDLGRKSQIALADASEKRQGFDAKKIKAAADAAIKLTEIEGQSLELQEKIENRRSAILDAAAAKEDARQKKAQEDAKRNLENLQKLRDEFLLSEREKLAKSFDDKARLANASGKIDIELLSAIEKAKAQALAKFDEAALKRLDDSKKKVLADNAELLNKQLAFNAEQLQIELDRIDQSTDNERLKNTRKLEIQLEYLQETLKITEQLALLDGVRTTEELQNIEKVKTAIKGLQNQINGQLASKETFAQAFGLDEKELERTQEGLQQFADIVSGIREIVNLGYQARLNEIDTAAQAEIEAIERTGASQEQKQKKIDEINKKAALQAYEIQKSQFETNKALGITQAIISGALAIMQGFAQLGPIAGAVAAVLTAAVTAAQIAVIATQKPPAQPKFADGGEIMIGGKSHAQGGSIISIDGQPVAEAEKGEGLFVMKRNAYAQHLSERNAAFGGRPWFAGTHTHLAAGGAIATDGGFSARASADTSIDLLALVDGFKQAAKEIPAPVLVYDEYKSFQESADRSVTFSGL